MSWSLCLLLLVAGAAAFECDSDTILRLATNRRQKDIEQECQRASKNEPCKDQDKVDKLWKAYEDVQKEYRKLVDDCVRERTSQRVRRHDPKDPDIDHTGHNHRMRRHGDHDPKDPDIDHTGHNHRRRRHEEHDPNDPNVDHSGHQHRRKRCEEHDHKEPNGERTEHEMKREQDHDPDDTNVDHSGHQHRRRRHDDHDPNDPNVDHTGHNHRRKREQEHDTNVDHSGHNHKRRRHVLRDLEPYSEPEREQIRNRRAICKSRSAENLNNFQNEFKNYCHRENICLPDEDLPAGEKRDKIKRLQEERAKKYHEYLLEGAYCNA